MASAIALICSAVLRLRRWSRCSMAESACAIARISYRRRLFHRPCATAHSACMTAPASQVGIALPRQRHLRQYHADHWSKAVFAATQTLTVCQRRFVSTVRIPSLPCPAQRRMRGIKQGISNNQGICALKVICEPRHAAQNAVAAESCGGAAQA